MLSRFLFSLILLLGLAPAPTAVQAQSGSLSDTYSGEELVQTGSEFFGSVAQGPASLVARAVSNYGLPNAYTLAEEAGGARYAGARYGEATMYALRRGEHPL